MGLRAAMQTDSEIAGKKTLFSYGADFERENSEQTYYGQDLNEFIASNGLNAHPALTSRSARWISAVVKPCEKLANT